MTDVTINIATSNDEPRTIKGELAVYSIGGAYHQFVLHAVSAHNIHENVIHFNSGISAGCTDNLIADISGGHKCYPLPRHRKGTILLKQLVNKYGPDSLQQAFDKAKVLNI